MLKQLLKKAFLTAAHFLGRITKRYYVEDYIRVYPGQVAYNRFGRKHRTTPAENKNYVNHRKFYQFCAQFVRGKNVADVGCGSGYGCEILAKAGAAHVAGCDISRHALAVAREQFGTCATFSEQGITELHSYADGEFDVTISSEVLEHIKEYQLEEKALQELKRVTRSGGLVIVGTPNAELLGDHGFYFHELRNLFAMNFETFCIFENALIPFGENIAAWEQRLAAQQTGIIVSERINLDETVLPEGAAPRIKSGLEPGLYRQSDLEIDTTRLHNTHSWVVVAQKA